jgi:hypothetical protein
VESGKEARALQLGVLSQNDKTPDDHEPDAPEWDCPECGATYYGSTTFCRECFKPPAPKHDTRKHIAKAAGVSTGQDGDGAGQACPGVYLRAYLTLKRYAFCPF